MYNQYWGKLDTNLTSAGENYHLLVYHSLDVAAVLNELLTRHVTFLHDLAELLEMSAEDVKRLLVFMASLHDIGKFASAFQAVNPHHYPHLISPKSRKEYSSFDYRHDRLGACFWEDMREQNLLNFPHFTQLTNRERSQIGDVLDILIKVFLGHHGQPVELTDAGKIKRSFTEPHNFDAALSFAGEMVELFQPRIDLEHCLSREWRARLKQVTWPLAGLMVMADWLGSDSEDFPFKTDVIPPAQYWVYAQGQAKNALQRKGLAKAFIPQPFSTIERSFGFSPTPLQKWAESVSVNEFPQLFILEDVTGAGKTEAALALVQRLMAAGAADGFYFGLPSMATSNAMFSRVLGHYETMYEGQDGSPSIVLAHNARDMNELFQNILEKGSQGNEQSGDSSSAECNHWFGDSRKKALLASVGVGTIDQALLAVLPRRHQSLRLYGLYRKVLVFDEVHAADEYMFELLENLLQLHFHQGGSAILLTATLSLSQRERLVKVWQRGYLQEQEPLLPQNKNFPLATRVAPFDEIPLLETALASRKEVSREVHVEFIHEFNGCRDHCIKAAEEGRCIVWVRNSVDDAFVAHQALVAQAELSPYPIEVLLFHSRFVLEDRQSREKQVLHVFGKEGDNSLRAGKILVATQVFQESLDVDCDELISDLCPIDDLIQRVGRLHRHTRNINSAVEAGCIEHRPAPRLFIYAPEWDEEPSVDWLLQNFRNTQFVYRSPGRLWLGMKVLREQQAIRMPEEARLLIESVYGDGCHHAIPQNFLPAENDYIAATKGKTAKGKSIALDWQNYGYSVESGHWHEDLLEISTRFSELEWEEVVLLKRNQNGTLAPREGEKRFCIALSTIKLLKHSIADKLASLPQSLAAEIEKLQNHCPQLRYKKCWLPELDEQFGYDGDRGFYRIYVE